jgi:hypothetical protein
MVLSITDDIIVDFGPPSYGFGCIVTELIPPCTGSAESRRELLLVIRFVLIFVWDVIDSCTKVNVQHAVVVSFLQHLEAFCSSNSIGFLRFVRMVLQRERLVSSSNFGFCCIRAKPKVTPVGFRSWRLSCLICYGCLGRSVEV